MGHFHSSNLDRLLLKQLYANGFVSVASLTERAQKLGEVVSASEGTYDEKYMLDMSFEILLGLHVDNGEIEPVLNTRNEKRVYKIWRAGNLDEADFIDNAGNSIGDLLVLDTMKFKFVRGKRKDYIDFIITEVDC